MKIYGKADKYENIPENKGFCVAVGNFDGFHLGHKRLLEELKKEAHNPGCETLVYTFEGHTLKTIRPENAPEIIMSNRQKAEAAAAEGIDAIYFETFDRAFASLSPEAFADNILAGKLGAKALAIGENFTFGAGGKGTAELLKELAEKKNIKTLIVPSVKLDGETVSSSSLRKFIKDGDFENYTRFAGRRFSIEGTVEHGREVGRRLGFPTANLSVREGFACPAHGVYATKTLINGKLYNGITNVGTNPTFKLNKVVAETHLFESRGDIYGADISVFFFKKIRDELCFENIDGLKAQIARDIEKGKMLLDNA